MGLLHSSLLPKEVERDPHTYVHSGVAFTLYPMRELKEKNTKHLFTNFIKIDEYIVKPWFHPPPLSPLNR